MLENKLPAFTMRRWLGPCLSVIFTTFVAPSISQAEPAPEPAPSKFHARDITGYKIDYGFTFKDVKGKEVKLSDFNNKVTLLFFGFTQCPMICPTALSRAAEIKKTLGPDGDRLQVVFVTVDPERDTPAVVDAYAKAFDPSFMGFATSAEDLKALSANLKFTYSKIETGSSYTMDHSTVTYAFDPSGKIRILFNHVATASDCADDIHLLLHETTK
jgi:protein SCO1/2